MLGQPAVPVGAASPAYGAGSQRGMSFPGAGAPPQFVGDVDGTRMRDSQKAKKGGFKDWKRR